MAEMREEIAGQLEADQKRPEVQFDDNDRGGGGEVVRGRNPIQ